MISEKIYEIGAMLGLGHKDIRHLLSDKSMVDITNNPAIPSSPMETYKDPGTWYGTVTINDF